MHPNHYPNKKLGHNFYGLELIFLEHGFKIIGLLFQVSCTSVVERQKGLTTSGDLHTVTSFCLQADKLFLWKKSIIIEKCLSGNFLLFSDCFR